MHTDLTYNKSLKIVLIHPLNDLSGSPMVLSLLIKGLVAHGHEVVLFTSESQHGSMLDDISGVDYHYFKYKWTPNRVVVLLKYIKIQFLLFFKLLVYRNDNAILYINTIMPFGALILGKLIGKRVIVHLHETSIKPKILMKFLIFITSRFADTTIYVSNYLMSMHPTSPSKMHMVSNCLSDQFTKKAFASTPRLNSTYKILMICSLKIYKGVNEFIKLSEHLSEYDFHLVLNASEGQIADWSNSFAAPKNLHIHGPQVDLHPFYSMSNLLLNLSHPDAWVETFGLTALEGMAYGLPVIVPDCGGIAELVDHGINGFKINISELDLIKKKIQYLLSDEKVYANFSCQAREKSKLYCQENQYKAIEHILHNWD